MERVKERQSKSRNWKEKTKKKYYYLIHLANMLKVYTPHEKKINSFKMQKSRKKYPKSFANINIRNLLLQYYSHLKNY